MNHMESTAYDVGLKVATFRPGDGATRYRFFREKAGATVGTYAYDGGKPLVTVNGRKAALAFLEAYKLGRENGIREAHAEVVNNSTSGHSLEQISEALVNLVYHGPWHHGETVVQG